MILELNELFDLSGPFVVEIKIHEHFTLHLNHDYGKTLNNYFLINVVVLGRSKIYTFYNLNENLWNKYQKKKYGRNLIHTS